MNQYDIIIIGAGHNGLTAAAWLAKAGKKVLVLEKRSVVGGACVGNGDAPDFAPFSGGFLRPDIIRHLNLTKFGLNPAPVSTNLISLLPDSRQLVLSADTAKTAASIAQFSEADAAKWPAFVRFMDRAAAFLDAAYATPIPRLPKFSPAEGLPLAQLALKLRSLGAKDMYAVIRLLPMSAKEFLDDWFEADVLKAALASLGIHNANLGVMSAGSAYNLLHQYLIRGGKSPERSGWGHPANDLRQTITALESAAKSYGAEIRTDAEVARITVQDYKVTGVLLASGEEISAPIVISSADPKRTFLSLVTPEPLDPEFVWQAQTIKMRGVTALVGAGLVPALVPALAGRPQGSPLRMDATYIIAPSMNYLEHAYDAAKYGQISEKPYLEITSSDIRLSALRQPSVPESVLNIHCQFAPYFLKNAAWDSATRATLEQIASQTLSEYAPNLKSQIQNLKSLTPLDLETTFSLTEGDPHHGQLALDQFFFMRPIPGYANQKTPIEGLYLCGSGVHGGGGVSGIPGRNAAKVVLPVLADRPGKK
jgi:phytoene dehydrogenase-like protein